MNSFVILVIFLSCFLALILAWFAISSCLGDEIRAAWWGRQSRRLPTTYGLEYARFISQASHTAPAEQIEMQDFLERDSMVTHED